MKRFFLLLMFLTIFILTMFGCQRKDSDNTVEIRKIENTTEIIIDYGYSSHMARITDPEEIKQLEDLFNGAEITKSDTMMEKALFLRIIFCGEMPVAFSIDHNDVIDLGDGKRIFSENCVKSEQINLEYLYSIFKEH